MSNAFLRNYDDILQEILDDYKNLDSAPDTSVGSIVYIKAAVLASCLWGLYRYQDYLAKQIFPDSCDTESLNHWGSIYGVTRTTTDTDSTYLAKVLAFIRTPAAGGTALDYKTWAEEVTPIVANPPENFVPASIGVDMKTITVTQPWVDEDPIRFTTTGTLPGGLVAGTTYYAIYVSATSMQVSATAGGGPITFSTTGSGIHTITSQTTTTYGVESATIVTPNTPTYATTAGEVDIIVMPTDETVLNPAEPVHDAVEYNLTKAVNDYIDTLRPVTANSNTTYLPTLVSQNIAMSITPATIELVTTVTTNITTFIDSLVPGGPLYIAQLINIALTAGATNASMTNPVVDVAVTPYQIIRPGVITISAL